VLCFSIDEKAKQQNLLTSPNRHDWSKNSFWIWSTKANKLKLYHNFDLCVVIATSNVLELVFQLDDAYVNFNQI